MTVERYKNFVIYGPGRTGSHWVESILIGLIAPASFRQGNFSLLPNEWIYHTNQLHECTGLPREIRDSVTLIVCNRSNHFDTAISHMIARHTDEWFVYTDKPVDPFNVDPEEFTYLLHAQRDSYWAVKLALEPMFSHIIHINYDKLAAADSPEKHVADLLGIEYTVNSTQYMHLSVKNTRNYKELILNWDQLVDIFQNYLVDR